MIDYNHLTIPEAIALQKEMRKDLRFNIPDDQPIHTIAGADISYNKDSNLFYAAIVVLNYPQMTLKGYALTTGISDFPYVPGFLGFREVPTLLKAWEQLPIKPDVVVLDGQGILHPRRMGIASHFGVLTHQATIGCAKSSLYGKYKMPSSIKYSFSEMHEESTLLGYALRTKDNNKPVYISPGYGLSLPKSLLVMKKCVGKYRIPEPTRIAHEIVNDFRLGKLKPGFHMVNELLELF